MKGYGIYVKNDLLDPKHFATFGTSPLWLYLWLLDKMTSIDESGTGKVLGGKPIKYDEIKKDLGLSRQAYVRYTKLLRDNNYIETTRTMYGLIFVVNKASKIFGNKKRVVSKTIQPDVSKVAKRCSKNEHLMLQKRASNKTIQLDNTKTIQKNTTINDVETIYNYFLEVFGYAPVKAKQTNINSITRLLAKNKVNASQVKKVMQYASTIQGEKYAPSINSFWDFEDKWPEIARYYKKNQDNKLMRI